MTMKRAFATACPHCKARGATRSSREMSATMREITFVCRNAQCGHVWVSTLEDVRTLSPSATPDMSIRLPLSRHVNLAKLRQSVEDMIQAPLDPAAM